MFIRFILMLVVVATVGTGVYWLYERNSPDSSAGQAFPPAAVSVTRVESGVWRQSMFAVGSLTAEHGVDIQAPLPGSVVAIHFESGQMVEKWDVLISQDIGINEAELDGLKATRELRKLQFERAERLLKEKQISQADYDIARASLDEAEAEVQAKHAFIVRKTVYAPFTGQLGIRQVNLGEYLEAGDPLVNLQVLDPIHVDYALPEQMLPRVFNGQSVEVRVPAFPDDIFEGAISAFEPSIDAATRNIRIRATLANPEHRLRPGMFAEVITIEPRSKPVLTLPETAVTYTPYGNSVFIIDSSGDAPVAQRRQVQTGKIQDGLVEIVEGLSEGDEVVVLGQNKLRNGMAVQVVPDPSLAQEGEAEPTS
ncbi:MAG: efflux RND transporter periplasmic adaptor subunit [Pseudomonadota bacterium]